MGEYSWRRYYGRGGAVLSRRVPKRRKPVPVKKAEPKQPVHFADLPDEVRHAQEVALKAAGERDE